MGIYQDILRVMLTLVYCYIVIKVVFPIANAVPIGPLTNVNQEESKPPSAEEPADDRMFKPPRFPYDGPFGFYSSGLLCIFDSTPYIGGWFGRSCAGPIAPFIQPTPPPMLTAPTTTTTTTTESPPPVVPTQSAINNPYAYLTPTPQQLQWMQMFLQQNGHGYNNHQHHQDPYEDYGDPIEGNPWEPDDDTIFIENYGRSAAKPGFKLGDPGRH